MERESAPHESGFLAPKDVLWRFPGSRQQEGSEVLTLKHQSNPVFPCHVFLLFSLE